MFRYMFLVSTTSCVVAIRRTSLLWSSALSSAHFRDNPYKIVGETSAHLHIFMVRSRISKIRLKAELCFHRPLHFVCVLILYTYISTNQSLGKRDYSLTACLGLVSCWRICAFHNYYLLLTKIDCNAPVYVKGKLADISKAFDKNQHDASSIKLEAYDIVLKNHLKHKQQRFI